MRTDPTPLPGDYDEPPFSNGSEGEYWIHNVCGAGDGCIHDSFYGQADEDDSEVNCPLITLSLFGTWPREWEREAVNFTSVDGRAMTYCRAGDCSEFTDEFPPSPAEPPVVAVNLFGQFDAEPGGAA